MGQPLAALTVLSQRGDAHARAVRGIALAQLGEFDRAKRELTSARGEFARQGETVWATKALAALAEIGLATRDIEFARSHLDATPLRADGDHASASYVDIQRARLYALLGRVDDARALLAAAHDGPAAELARAETAAAAGCFRDAARHATASEAGANPMLAGEARRLRQELNRQAFILHRGGVERRLSLVELEDLDHPYVDTIRRRCGDLDLQRRPGQFELLVGLARGPVTTTNLFGRSNESLQVRLRMEVSRVRRATGFVIEATEMGFVCPGLGLLVPEVDDPLALLADGESWSPRALAAVWGESVRTVERRLREQPGITATGLGRARRYATQRGLAATATRLLLLARADVK